MFNMCTSTFQNVRTISEWNQTLVIGPTEGGCQPAGKRHMKIMNDPQGWAPRTHMRQLVGDRVYLQRHLQSHLQSEVHSQPSCTASSPERNVSTESTPTGGDIKTDHAYINCQNFTIFKLFSQISADLWSFWKILQHFLNILRNLHQKRL